MSRVWVAELDDLTCDDCAMLDGVVIEDDEVWEEAVGAYPGDVHENCRCFEVWYPVEQFKGTGEELGGKPIPQGLQSGAYRYIFPVGALLLLWRDEKDEEPVEDLEPTQEMEDDYERMERWTNLW